jgi:hypothetical protein
LTSRFAADLKEPAFGIITFFSEKFKNITTLFMRFFRKNTAVRLRPDRTAIAHVPVDKHQGIIFIYCPHSGFVRNFYILFRRDEGKMESARASNLDFIAAWAKLR